MSSNGKMIDFQEIDRAADNLCRSHLDQTCSGGGLLNQLRAFSFPPYEGCYFIDEAGKKISMTLQLNRGVTKWKKPRGPAKSYAGCSSTICVGTCCEALAP